MSDATTETPSGGFGRGYGPAWLAAFLPIRCRILHVCVNMCIIHMHT